MSGLAIEASLSARLDDGCADCATLHGREKIFFERCIIPQEYQIASWVEDKTIRTEVLREGVVMNEGIKNAVCWIGFFPSAVIAAFLVFVIVQMGYQGAYFWAFLVPIHESYSSSSWSPVFVWKLVREIVANLALGATFVWAGAKIVPSGKKIAAFLMALVLIAISAYSILFGREIV